MKLLSYLSDFGIPLIIFFIVSGGLARKVAVYDRFVEGAKKGLKTTAGILPTLIGLMVGVGILRASGFLDFLSEVLRDPARLISFPSELLPMILVRMFSSSAATGLLLDVYRSYGADSFLGIAASIMMSCTETIFYTMSVYFLAAGVKKTRWTLAGALVSTLIGLAASVLLAGMVQL